MFLKSLTAGIAASVLLTGTALAASPALKATHVIVDRNSQTLKVYSGTKVIAKSRVSTGRAGYTTPSGIFTILQKRKRHFSNLYNDAPMPNMQRLTWTGIALHGSNSVPRRPASHGCIRLPRGFDAKLFRMTQYGAHVIVSRGPVTPDAIAHPALFKPLRKPTNSLVSADTGIVTDVRRPSAAAAAYAAMTGKKVNRSDGTSPSPLRIFITRNNASENRTLVVQKMLNELGWNAGTEDGLFGRQTAAAIQRFESMFGEGSKGKITDALIAQLKKITGRGEEPNGKIYVRQDFRPVFEAGITIRDPQKPLGAHLISAINVDREAGEADWISMTMRDRLSPYQQKRLGVVQAPKDRQQDINAVLSRLDIPQDVRERISELLTKNSSISISDKGLSSLTSRKGGTDFIVRTSG